MARAAFTLFILISLTICPGGFALASGQGPEGRISIALLISKEILPYLKAADGFEEEVRRSNPAIFVRRYSLEEQELSPERLSRILDSSGYRAAAAVGPEAARLLWAANGVRSVKRFYCMVLDPERVVERGACGVPLNIAAFRQLQAVCRLFPEIRRIGILYDPDLNAGFVLEASAAAADMDITIVPLEVRDRGLIKQVLGDRWASFDALWLIPDRTVISETLVRYIIKEALRNGRPVIGYNRFFHSSGALMSFILDYGRIGRQAARLCLDVLSGKGCRRVEPAFSIWINRRAGQILGIALPRADESGMEVVIK